MTRYCPLLVICSLLILSACDTQSVLAPEAHDATPQHTATSTSTSLALASQLPAVPGASELRAKEASKHIVQLKGNKIRSFSAEAASLGGEVTYLHEKLGIAVVSGLSAEAAADLARSSAVRQMEEDEILYREEPAARSEPLAASIASPTDPAGAFFFARQWHHTAIGADKAWEAGKLGSEDVTVAILDSGIDYLYPDLDGRVDLDRSASFIPIDDLYTEFFFPDRHPITDLGYHGTHVAATAASNGLVGAGVTSRTTLIGVKVCSVVDGGCPASAIISGILHAVDNGADVINMSLGGYLFKQGSGRTVGFYNTLFNYARQNGVTVVVAAGNDAVDMDHYNGETVERDDVVYPLSPATFTTYCSASNVICVSATGPTAAESETGPWTDVDAPAAYTNYGRSAINVAAPGGNTGGAVYAGCSQTSLIIPDCQTGFFILGLSGTSMAAPHASGLAALLVAEGYKPAQIRARIQKSADDLGQRGTDPYYGKGRINVAAALGL